MAGKVSEHLTNNNTGGAKGKEKRTENCNCKIETIGEGNAGVICG